MARSRERNICSPNYGRRENSYDMLRCETMIWIDHDGNWIEIVGKECTVTIEPRPSYCDRGNWIAKLFPTGKLALEIDEADCWPRYYFDHQRAKLEVEAWLIKRGQVQ